MTRPRKWHHPSLPQDLQRHPKKIAAFFIRAQPPTQPPGAMPTPKPPLINGMRFVRPATCAYGALGHTALCGAAVCKACCKTCGGKHLTKRCGKDFGPLKAPYAAKGAPRSYQGSRRSRPAEWDEPPQKRRKMEGLGSMVADIKKSVTEAISAAMPSTSTAPAPAAATTPVVSARPRAKPQQKRGGGRKKKEKQD